MIELTRKVTHDDLKTLSYKLYTLLLALQLDEGYINGAVKSILRNSINIVEAGRYFKLLCDDNGIKVEYVDVQLMSEYQEFLEKFVDLNKN